MTFAKFKLLCWKNFTLQKRSPWSTLFDIAFPVLVVAFFVALRNGMEMKNDPEIEFLSFKADEDCEGARSLGVSPSNNPALEKLVTSSIGDRFKVSFFENALALESFLLNRNDTKRAQVIGLEFEDRLSVSHEQAEAICIIIRPN